MGSSTSTPTRVLELENPKRYLGFYSNEKNQKQWYWEMERPDGNTE
jgi:hypothetical protein